MRPPRGMANLRLNCVATAGACRYHASVDTTGAATKQHGRPTATQVMCLSELALALQLGQQSARSGLSKTASRLGTRFSSEGRCSLSSARPSARVTAPAIPSCTGEELIQYGLRMTRRVTSDHPQWRRTRQLDHRLHGSHPCPPGYATSEQALQLPQKCRPGKSSHSSARCRPRKLRIDKTPQRSRDDEALGEKRNDGQTLP